MIPGLEQGHRDYGAHSRAAGTSAGHDVVRNDLVTRPQEADRGQALELVLPMYSLARWRSRAALVSSRAVGVLAVAGSGHCPPRQRDLQTGVP